MNPIYYSEYNYCSNNYIPKHKNQIIQLEANKDIVESLNIECFTNFNKEVEIDKLDNNILNEKNIEKEEINSNIIIDDVKKEITEFKNIYIKQYILNPLTVIIKLSILSCKPIGTKIHIQNNKIFFQEPGIFQSFTRYLFNSNKSHLQYFYNPIKLACQKYLSKKFIQTTPNIVNLFIFAKNGLDNLIKTYSNCPLTVLCLKYYHIIITNCINETNINFLYKDSIINSEDETKEFYTNDILNKFENQWSSSKLKIILDLMDFLFNYDSNENKSNNIKSLETIINNSDEETQKLFY